ncbi:hypothetical protein J4G33_06545 [Actinotalea sp. BY-33]|uniref:Uncharacterized protein n=1 Tax=Actinotalea soli TaxID=2819234 RepID=A0A939LR22_9CELL|nr:hypothetical protein [Actinotalea soli]MBO1751460.1 hypothetical protein [Actinotalea soli]
MPRPSSSHVTTRTRAVVGAGLVAAILVGCSGGDDASEENPAGNEVSASETSVDPSAPDEPRAPAVDLLDASSRIAVITSCEGLLPSIAPALTANHTLTTDSVSSYGSTTDNAFSFTCVFTDSTNPNDTVTLEGAAGRSTTTREEVIELNPEEELFATDIAEHTPYGNVTFLKPTDNGELTGTFAAHVWSPTPDQSSMTGTVRLTYDYATEVAEGDEYQVEPTRAVPTDDAAVVALTGVLQAVD